MNDVATRPIARETSAHDFLAGGGEMGARMRAHDWSASPLGDPGGWPQSLRTAISLMINSRHPMFIAWGPELAFLYNDGYIPIFGAKHPHTLGLPFEQVWSEIWDDVRPFVERALAGEATWSENLHLVMERNGFPEDTWYSFSYSPIRDEGGGIGGMFCACQETTQQIRAEDALRESEGRFRNLADHAPVMMWVTNADGRCVYLNRAWYEFTGQTPEQAEGFGWLDATHTDDKAMAEAAFLDANANQRAFRLEYRLRRGDGAYRWAIDAAAPRFGPGGEFLGYVGSVIDIDERRESEDALRESEERLRTIFDEANDFIFTIGLDQRLTALNPATAAAMGISPEQGIGRSIAEFMSPEDFAKANARLAAKLDGGASTRYEIEVTSAAGKRMVWEINSRLNRAPSGAPLGLHVIARDVTDKRRADDALRESEARLRATVQASPFPTMLHAEDGEVIELSSKWTELTGYTRDEIRTHFDWFRLAYPNQDQAELGRFIAREFAQEGEIAVGELAIRTRNGGERIWDFHNVRVGQLPDGRGLLVSAANDVTGRRASEDRLRESEERFRALAENIPILCWMADASGDIFWYNSRWYEYTGRTPEDQLGWGWESVHDPAMVSTVVERWTRSLATGEPFEMMFPLKGADGQFRTFLTRVVPLRDDEGAIVRWFGTNTDVTEQRRTEEHLKLLVGELNHRVKNTLAIVQAVARQSLQDVPAEDREGFEGRLQALAAAHNLLTRENWESADLGDIVREVAAACHGGERRFTISGPPLRLDPKVAVTVAMATHELCTNAVKYGALANDSGRVAIAWTVGERLHLRWEESGGPPVVPPTRRGFGSRMIERALASELNATVRLDYRPEGLVCDVDGENPRRRTVV